MSAPFLLVPKGGFMMTVSARNLLCIPSAPTSHLTKSTCTQRYQQSILCQSHYRGHPEMSGGMQLWRVLLLY